MFNIIIKSLLRQGIRIKIIFMQMVIVFLALNVGFSLTYSGIKFDRDIKNFMEPNKELKVSMDMYSNSNDKITKRYNAIYDYVRNSNLVQNYGAFLQYQTTSKEWIVNSKVDNYKLNKLFVDIPALSLYNFQIQSGDKLDSSLIKSLGNTIPVLVGANLKDKLPLNSVFNIQELINGKLVNINLKVVGIIKQGSLFWSLTQNENNRLSNLDNTVIVPICGSCSQIISQNLITFFLGNSIVAKFNDKSDMNKFIKDVKSTYAKDGCTIVFKTSQDLVKEKYDANKTWLGIIFTFTLMLMLLSTIGLVGVVLSYIEKRTREFGIRYIMGSSIKKLVELIFGEIFMIFTLADILTILIYTIVSQIVTLELVPPVQALPFILSILVAIFLGALTSFIPILSIMRTKPAELIKGEKK